MNDLSRILQRCQNGELSLEETLAAVESLYDRKAQGIPEAAAELGYATVDLDRERRTGFPEVIFGANKTAEQLIGIFRKLTELAQLPFR